MTSNQIYNFVNEHLTIVDEPGDELACYCPFHENTDSPAFYINKHTGLWHCFNAQCGQKGRYTTLVKRLTGVESVLVQDVSTDKLEQMLTVAGKIEDEGFDEAMDRITINYRDPVEVSRLQYLIDRGFHPSVLEHFEVGFSKVQGRAVIPVRDENFKVVGFVGRATSDEVMPKYKYTDKFPRRNIILNLCNAKQYDMAIVVEGSLDHIMVHQAGFPNVVSTMGSTVSPEQLALLNKYFSSLVIFSDNDAAGDNMKGAIIEGAPKKELFVVQYPEGPKDPGDMSSLQIQEAIHTRITHLEYLFLTL
jgi:DNA primase